LLNGYCVGIVGGQWLDRSASASVALDDAWLGRDVGWSKVQGTVPGGPVGWLECIAACIAVGPIAMTAGTAAMIKVTANRAITFDLMLFPEITNQQHAI
jgi:hypothetical protein